MQLKYLLFLAFAAMVAARTTTGAEVIADLQELETQAQQLAANIQNLTPGNIPNELTLQGEFTATQKMIDSTNLDVQNTSGISSDDAETVVATLTQLVDIVVGFLQVLVSKAGGFSGFEKNFIANDLQAVGGSIQSLETNLRSKCPEEYQATADRLISQTNTGFSTALQAFS